jgi:hypothetical protein
MRMPCPRESWCGHRLGRNVLVELPIPELVALGFREVGMSNPKCCLVGGHGPGEQLFVVDRMESHGAGVPYQEKEMDHLGRGCTCGISRAEKRETR